MKKDNHMKYLLPLAIALVFTACNDAKKAGENTTAPVEQNMTETNATDAAAATETNATDANATEANATEAK
jgi:hypothetical protein